MVLTQIDSDPNKPSLFMLCVVIFRTFFSPAHKHLLNNILCIGTVPCVMKGYAEQKISVCPDYTHGFVGANEIMLTLTPFHYINT